MEEITPNATEVAEYKAYIDAIAKDTNYTGSVFNEDGTIANPEGFRKHVSQDIVKFEKEKAIAEYTRNFKENFLKNVIGKDFSYLQMSESERALFESQEGIRAFEPLSKIVKSRIEANDVDGLRKAANDANEKVSQITTTHLAEIESLKQSHALDISAKAKAMNDYVFVNSIIQRNDVSDTMKSMPQSSNILLMHWNTYCDSNKIVDFDSNDVCLDDNGVKIMHKNGHLTKKTAIDLFLKEFKWLKESDGDSTGNVTPQPIGKNVPALSESQIKINERLQKLRAAGMA